MEKQFNRRVAWWSRKRWRDVIAIPAELEGPSLLTCHVDNLSTVTLFNLTPEKLQANLQNYWKKPAWRRCLQRCFSSINQQLEVWSYYQQCLAFRAIKASYLPEHSSLTVLPVALKLKETLGNFFTTKDSQFEGYVSKQSAQRFKEQFFKKELTNYARQRKRQFFQYLEEQLKKELPETRSFLEKEIKEGYDIAEKIMNEYLVTWYQGIYLLPPPSIKDWVKKSRQELRHILQDEKVVYANKLSSFFEEKLKVFNDKFIEPLHQLSEAPKKDEEYKKELLRTMETVYRKAALFFHPDNNRDLISDDKELESYFNTSYNEFNKYLIRSKAVLRNKYSEKEEINREFYKLFELQKALNKEIREMSEEVEARIAESNAMSAKFEARMAESNAMSVPILESSEKLNVKSTTDGYLPNPVHPVHMNGWFARSSLESKTPSYLQETNEALSLKIRLS